MTNQIWVPVIGMDAGEVGGVASARMVQLDDLSSEYEAEAYSRAINFMKKTPEAISFMVVKKSYS